MKRFALLLALAAAPLGGCVVTPVGAPPPPGPRPVAVWIPGHYGPNGYWIPGHYRG